MSAQLSIENSAVGEKLLDLDENKLGYWSMQNTVNSKMNWFRVVFVIFVMLGAAFLIAAHSHDDTEDVHCAVCRVINNQALVCTTVIGTATLVAVDRTVVPTSVMPQLSAVSLLFDLRAPPQVS